jgi:protein O-mannosyl-transferase
LLKWIICLMLGFGTLALYAPVRHYQFVKYDDDEYITQNPHVLGGFNKDNVTWAFTREYSSNWHPLTWLSHILDIQVWGLRAGGHHLTNAILHAVNAVLLFLVFASMTGTLSRSAFVATVFAWHPLHVESVAWISERKDVLSALFWILTIAAYVYYGRRPSYHRYLLVVLGFALGLMCKPMLVTLPCVLLLLDYWPLNRVALTRSDIRKWFDLLVEKIPLFALVVVSCIITLAAQRVSGAMKPVSELPLLLRLSNVPLSYLRYLSKAIWPFDLAIFYPLPFSIPLWQAIGSAAVLIALTLLALFAIKRSPAVTVGWLWFLGTLVPAIGLVQVGYQSMADRYMYVPLIGLTVTSAWGAWDLLKKYGRGGVIASVLFVGVAVSLLYTGVQQLRYWHDSVTLFQHTLSITRDNWLVHNNLSNALLDKPGALGSAESHAREAIRLRPSYAPAYLNLGVALLRQGKASEAIAQLETANWLQPNWPDAYVNLASAKMVNRQTSEAIADFREALHLNPDDLSALKALAWIRATQSVVEWRNGEEAVRLAERAARLTNYKDATTLDVLAAALAESGRFEAAIKMGGRARDLALAGNQFALADEIAQRLELYHLGLPYRTTH